ncbi:hypothetical protein [Halovulum marinum]|nr:hypothetical protein [Halovulum marinum]
MEHVSLGTAGYGLRHPSLWQRLLRFVLSRDAAFRQRHALGRLDDHLRRDVGLLDGHATVRRKHPRDLLDP